MPDPAEDAVSKIETEIVATLDAYASLSGWTILSDQPLDEAIEGDEIKALVVRSMGPAYENFELNSQSLNTLTIDVEAVVKEAGVAVARRAREGIGHALAALSADRTLGGMLQDMQEIDATQGDAHGREAGSISLQLRVQYFTDRTDPFTIYGAGGTTF